MVELLRMKLFVPRRRSKRVSRPRLIERLNSGLDKKLTLIAAPAGFGKTSLLSEWIPQSSRRVAWFSIDDGDNDPSLFWAYFIASLQTLHPGLGRGALASLQSLQAPRIPSILTPLINDVAALPEALAIVLDDYHVIENQSIQAGMAFLIDHLPANLHLLIITRLDPPLPVARLRARDQLTELRAGDLRFTADEVDQFLTRVMGLGLSSEQIAALGLRTEGWIAGLQIAALSMQGHEDISGFIQSFSGSHRHIVGYLAEEILNQQPQDRLDFLLQTSILDRLCGPLCEAVTGESGGQATLDELERLNLFITALDDQGHWYRYHQLFSEVLQARLRKERAAAIPELHRRAGAWCEQNDLMAESIQHFLAASDFERAGVLIENIGMETALRGQALAVFDWLEALPEHVVHANPRLCVEYAWLLLSFSDFRRADTYLEFAEKALGSLAAIEASSPELQNIRGEFFATRAMQAVYQRGVDSGQLTVWSEQALQDLRPDNTPFRSTATGILGTAYRNQRDWPRAEAAFARAAAMDRVARNVMPAFAASMQQSLIQRARGAFRLAVSTSQDALDWAAEQGVASSPFAGGVASHLADLLRERNELDQAVRLAHSGVERSAQTGNPHQQIASLLILARVEQARGNFKAARDSLLQAQQLALENQAAWFLNLAPAIEIQFLLAQGNLTGAVQHLSSANAWATAWRDFIGSYELIFGYEIGRIAPWQVQIRQGSADRDASRLRQIIDGLEAQKIEAEKQGLGWFLTKTLTLQALAYDGLGDKPETLACLRRALAHGEKESHFRIFVDEGEPLRLLLLSLQSTSEKEDAQVLVRDTLRRKAYVPRLLAAFSTKGSIKSSNQDRLPEPLSERELEVLRLIAAGHSNREIAELLVIAVSTVKSHINNLYGKLGTKRRTEAVLIARKIGLLAN